MEILNRINGLVTTASYHEVFGDEPALPTRKIEMNYSAWRKLDNKVMQYRNLQDDKERNVEVGIHPQTLQTVKNQDNSLPGVAELRKS